MQCVKCGTDKPLDDFYARDRTCKVCRCAMVRANRAAKLEKYRGYDRARAKTDKRMAQNRAVGAAWRERHPKHRAAQVALGNALRSGKVSRWPVCAVPECDKTRTVGHHPDYDQPLQVVWLCQGHHKQAHNITSYPHHDH